MKVPKLGAVKRGWVRQFVVVCDFKLFLYDISADRSALPSVHVTQVRNVVFYLCVTENIEHVSLFVGVRYARS